MDRNHMPPRLVSLGRIQEINEPGRQVALLYSNVKYLIDLIWDERTPDSGLNPSLKEKVDDLADIIQSSRSLLFAIEVHECRLRQERNISDGDLVKSRDIFHQTIVDDLLPHAGRAARTDYLSGTEPDACLLTPGEIGGIPDSTQRLVALYALIDRFVADTDELTEESPLDHAGMGRSYLFARITNELGEDVCQDTNDLRDSLEIAHAASCDRANEFTTAEIANATVCLSEIAERLEQQDAFGAESENDDDEFEEEWKEECDDLSAFECAENSTGSTLKIPSGVYIVLMLAIAVVAFFTWPRISVSRDDVDYAARLSEDDCRGVWSIDPGNGFQVRINLLKTIRARAMSFQASGRLLESIEAFKGLSQRCVDTLKLHEMRQSCNELDKQVAAAEQRARSVDSIVYAAESFETAIASQSSARGALEQEQFSESIEQYEYAHRQFAQAVSKAEPRHAIQMAEQHFESIRNNCPDDALENHGGNLWEQALSALIESRTVEAHSRRLESLESAIKTAERACAKATLELARGSDDPIEALNLLADALLGANALDADALFSRTARTNPEWWLEKARRSIPGIEPQGDQALALGFIGLGEAHTGRIGSSQRGFDKAFHVLRRYVTARNDVIDQCWRLAELSHLAGNRSVRRQCLGHAATAASDIQSDLQRRWHLARLGGLSGRLGETDIANDFSQGVQREMANVAYLQYLAGVLYAYSGNCNKSYNSITNAATRDGEKYLHTFAYVSWCAAREQNAHWYEKCRLRAINALPGLPQDSADIVNQYLGMAAAHAGEFDEALFRMEKVQNTYMRRWIARAIVINLSRGRRMAEARKLYELSTSPHSIDAIAYFSAKDENTNLTELYI